jgi:hypothetical protein
MLSRLQKSAFGVIANIRVVKNGWRRWRSLTQYEHYRDRILISQQNKKSDKNISEIPVRSTRKATLQYQRYAVANLPDALALPYPLIAPASDRTLV